MTDQVVTDQAGGKPVEEWAPIFTRQFSDAQILRPEYMFSPPGSTATHCKLCDAPVTERREVHAQRHARELSKWREAGNKPTNQGGSTMAKDANKKQAGPKEAPKELVERIVREIEEGVGLTALAKKLTEEKVPTLGKSTVWHPPVVRGIYMKATGAKGVKDVRKKHPVASKKTADAPAKPAEKLDKPGKSTEQVVAEEQAEHDAAEKTAAEAKAKTQVEPDPKPTSRKRGAKAGATA